ncbi:hypothetical protein W02_03540 [Nitrospira sp. KM1]|nr:hypothetical protein W02_03540 [Nitrospira sp. KM1]
MYSSDFRQGRILDSRATTIGIRLRFGTSIGSQKAAPDIHKAAEAMEAASPEIMARTGNYYCQTDKSPRRWQSSFDNLSD